MTRCHRSAYCCKGDLQSPFTLKFWVVKVDLSINNSVQNNHVLDAERTTMDNTTLEFDVMDPVSKLQYSCPRSFQLARKTAVGWVSVRVVVYRTSY